MGPPLRRWLAITESSPRRCPWSPASVLSFDADDFDVSSGTSTKYSMPRALQAPSSRCVVWRAHALRYAARRGNTRSRINPVSTPGPHWRMNRPRNDMQSGRRSRVRCVAIGAVARMAGDVCVHSASAFEAIGLRQHRGWRVVRAPAVPRRMSRRARLSSARTSRQTACASRSPRDRGRRARARSGRAQRRNHELPASHTRLALPAVRTDRPSRDRAGADRFAAIVSRFCRTL